PPARAVPAPDRGEPDRPARLRVRDVGRPEALLRPLGRSVRAARPRAPAARGRPRARRRLRRRLHRPAARELPPGRAPRPRARAGGLRRLHRPAEPLACAPRPGRGGSARRMTAAQAYAEVERLTRRRARNFAYGIMVLPRPKRRAIAAVYAFAREVDDVADGDLPAEEKRARLEGLGRSLDGSPNGSATLVALA